MSLLEEQNRIEKLHSDCEILLQAKKILMDYYSNYKPNSNASKLDLYLSKMGDDMYNPFLMLKENMKLSCETMDSIFIIKKSQILRLN